MEESTSHKSALTIIFLLLFGLSSCSTSPSKHYRNQSSSYGFSESKIETTVFDLTTYEKEGNLDTNSLHIYIDGDGQPFIHNRFPSKDPTSKNGLMLKLMSLDPNHSILLGRPCYHDDQARNCKNSKWWTSHRYSQTVVNEMAKAIEQLNTENKKVVLIGFSGGGALAMLLSTRIKELSHIFTINANIDINAWTEKHQYTPLYDSLNPIDYLHQTKELPQTHLIGLKDQNVPNQSWVYKLKSGQNTKILRYPDFSHSCCWSEVWNAVINRPY